MTWKRKKVECRAELLGYKTTYLHFPAKHAKGTLVCFHGWLDNAASFVPLAESLPDYEFFAWDFLGHGKSAHKHLGDRYHYIDLIPFIDAALFHLGKDNIILTGHSMGGHGALVLALRHPGRFRSVSALAPICNPSVVPWGRKAFTAYLGEDPAAWHEHDAVELLRRGARLPGSPLIDQGEADKFLADQLHPDTLARVCAEQAQPLTLRRHPGYDHSYFFIATFIADHIAHHARALTTA